MRQCKRYIVRGVVQRVGYRFFTQQQCRVLEINGWVCNRANGDVEVLACGDDTSLLRLEQILWSGPSYASVEHVYDEVIAHEQCDVSTEFCIR